MNRKTFLQGLTGLTAVAVWTATGTSLLAQSGEPIKIGEINHYKRMAAFAEPYKKGIELALEEINADGGVMGRPWSLFSATIRAIPVRRSRSPRN